MEIIDNRIIVAVYHFSTITLFQDDKHDKEPVHRARSDSRLHKETNLTTLNQRAKRPEISCMLFSKCRLNREMQKPTYNVQKLQKLGTPGLKKIGQFK